MLRNPGILTGIDHVIPVGIAGFGQLLHCSGALGHGIQSTQGEGQFLCNPGNENCRGILQLRQDLRHLVIELIQGQNGLTPGKIQIEGDLPGSGQGMDHIGNGTDPVQSIETIQCLRRIGHADGNLVALADAHFPQSPCGGINALHELGIGSLLAHEHIGSVLGILLCRFRKQPVHRHMGIFHRYGGIAIISRPGSRCRDTHNSVSSLSLLQGVKRTYGVIIPV